MDSCLIRFSLNKFRGSILIFADVAQSAKKAKIKLCEIKAPYTGTVWTLPYALDLYRLEVPEQALDGIPQCRVGIGF